MIQHITSRANPQVKSLLKQKENYLFFEGEKLVSDILSQGISVEILILCESKAHSLKLNITNAPSQIWEVSDTVMEKLSSLKETQSAIAVIKPGKEKIDFSAASVVIGLDRLQDPGNAGTIFRCAAAFGFNAIAFSGPSVQPANPRFLRAAQNAFFDVHYQYFENTEQLIQSASEAGLNIYLTASHSSGTTLSPEQAQFPCLILFGNEGQGLPEELLLKYPAITLSQTNRVESLNVGVSACIIMHELRKKMKL